MNSREFFRVYFGILYPRLKLVESYINVIQAGLVKPNFFRDNVFDLPYQAQIPELTF